MKTTARTRANRKNARRSTGPRTKEGKALAARNAVRHGLAVPVASLPRYDEAIHRQAIRIAGADAGPERLEVAYRIAEATVDLERIRLVKRAHMQKLMPEVREGETDTPADAAAGLIAELSRFNRYECRALSRRKFAIRAFDALPPHRATDAGEGPSNEPNAASADTLPTIKDEPDSGPVGSVSVSTSTESTEVDFSEGNPPRVLH